MKKFKCLLFDFDGTLADTSEGIIHTEEAMLKQMGLPEGNPAQMRQGIGLALRDSLKVGCLIPEERLDEAVETYRSLFSDVALDYIVAFPGVKDTLAYLYDKGYQMGMATSRSSRSLYFLMRKLEIEAFFHELSSVETTPKHKPEPDQALYLLERFGADPDETLVIGDTIYDIMMGQGAGCHTCGVSYGNHSAAQLASAGPDFILPSFEELKTIL